MDDADAEARASAPDPWLRAVGPALAVLSVGLAAAVHHGVGPALGGEDPAWYHPRGFLREPMTAMGLTDPARAIAALTLPMAALAAAVVLTTRSALARTAAVASALATGLFAYYGERLVVVWQIYGGHWSATLVLFAVVVAVALCAVWLTRSWLRLPLAAKLAAYAPLFGFVLAFERNVTGTDPALRFSLSPWPLVQVFALETFATAVALLLLGVGVGILALGHVSPRVGRPAAAVLALGVALGLPSASLGLGAELGLPFRRLPGSLGLVSGVAALLLAAAALPLWGAPRGRTLERGRLFTTAALLLGLPLLLGQALTRLDYVETREVRARRIIEALGAHYDAHGTYPDTLEALVEEGRLEAVPEPRIGFPGLPRPDFGYDSFGTSYILEFAAPRWIQCAYNPPWEDELADEADGAEAPEDGDRALAASWSCPSNPPELW